MVSLDSGAGAASAGAVLNGVDALGDMGGSFLKGGNVNMSAIRQTVNNMRSDAANVKDSHISLRGSRNPLERRW